MKELSSSSQQSN